MAAKVTFDAPNKRIIVDGVTPTNGVIALDVQVDLYSDAKEDWLNDSTLNKFTFPFEAIGGQDLPGGKFAGRLFFLKASLGWKIAPYEGDHEFRLEGNIYTDDGTALTVPTSGGYTVTVVNERSNLAQGQTGLTDTQAEQLLHIFKVLGLDSTDILRINDTYRKTDSGDIDQTISKDGGTGEVSVQQA